MNDDSSLDPASLSVWAEERIDRICAEFEELLKAGESPNIETYLGDESGQERDWLLRELILLDLDYGRADDARLDEFATRFPDHSRIVQAAFDAHFERSSKLSHSTTVTNREALTDHDRIAPEPEGTKFGDYVLIDKIGEGGMRVVYRAWQRSLRREVALKMVRVGMLTDKRAIERFQTEAKAAASLDHHGIVRIFDSGQHEDQYFFSMELIDGESLAAQIRSDKETRPPHAAAKLMQAVCEAVGYAHEQGVVHRDLKPANILLKGKDSQPMVADFGVAKQTESECDLTASGQIIGTAGYMPPEQARGDLAQIGPRSDIYSLGATLYAQLVGRPPFQADSPYETLKQTIEQEPVPPRQLNTAIPRDLETVCLKTLQKDPKRRYDSASELADDLKRFLEDKPIVARRAGRIERTYKWTRRHPVLSVAMAVVVLCLISVTVLSISLWKSVEAESIARGSAESKQKAAEVARRDERRARLATLAALKETKQARDETKVVYGHTLEVLDFLVQSFRSPDPNRDGRNVTVAEVLDQSVVNLEKRFPNNPQIQSGLLMAIGKTYLGLGLMKKSVATFQRGLELRVECFGEDHKDTIAIADQLCGTLVDTDKWMEAEPLLIKWIAISQKTLGKKNLHTLSLRSSQAHFFLLDGDADRGLALMQDCLKTVEQMPELDIFHLKVLGGVANAHEEKGDMRKTLEIRTQLHGLMQKRYGEEHVQTIQSLVDLAKSYREFGQLDKAISLLEECHQFLIEKLGEEHPNTIRAALRLADSYLNVRQDKEAFELHQKALQLSKKNGIDHPTTVWAMHSLVGSYRRMRKFNEAVKLASECLNLCQTRLGPDHPSTLQAFYDLAIALQDVGDWKNSLQLFERCLKGRREKLGDDHPLTTTTMSSIAYTHIQLGNNDEALAQYQKLVEFNRAKHGNENPKTLLSINNLAATYMRFQRNDKAMPLLEECVKLSAKIYGKDHLHTINHKHNYAASIPGHTDKAIELIRECLVGIRKKLGPHHRESLHILENLGLKTLYAKKHEEAEPLLRENLTLRKECMPDHWETFEAQSYLGDALLRLKKYEQAEPHFIGAYEGLVEREQKIPPALRSLINRTINRLASLYDLTSKPEQAKEWRAKLTPAT